MIKFTKLNTKSIFMFFILSIIANFFGWVLLDRAYVMTNHLSISESRYLETFPHFLISLYDATDEVLVRKFLQKYHEKNKSNIYIQLPNKKIISLKKPPVNVITAFLGYKKNSLSKYRVMDTQYRHGLYLNKIDISDNKSFLVAMDSVPSPNLNHDKIEYRILFRSLGIISAAGLILYFILSYYFKPIKIINSALKDISTGKLSARIGAHFKNKKDELGEVGRNFDFMAENIEALILSKEKLLQNISHELRSPLARLQVASTIGRSKTKALALTEFNRIDKEVIALDQLIEEILSLAKLSSGAVQVEKTSFNLLILLEKIVEDANFESNSKRVFLNTSPLNNVFLDKNLIASAIENIIRNALLHTEENKYIEVNLSQTNKELTIVVSDNGFGIPENDLKTIFEPFIQVNAQSNKKVGGYGLGLAMAKQVVQLHNGIIMAKNKEHSGLEITIIIPKEAADIYGPVPFPSH